MRDLPEQVPAPGWRVHVALHQTEPLLSRWERGYPKGVELDAPFQRPPVWTDAQRREVFQAVGAEHRRLRRPGEERCESISRQDPQIEGERLLFDSGEAPRGRAPVERYATEAECIEDTKDRLRRALERQGLVLYEEHVEGGAIVECEPDRRLRQA